MDNMGNYGDYIGIPYVKGGRNIAQPNEGLDCWGLACYFYKKEFNVILPIYQSINTNKDNIKDCSENLILTECYSTFEETSSSKLGDLILFRIGQYPIHIGIALDDKTMLHAHDKLGSVIERFDGLKWKNRLVSIHTIT
jgi:cell wall-associated NlpC family hydrolase